MSDVAVGWNDDRIARLRSMVAEGGSAAAIAQALGGVTRNGVIGKVHRLGLAFGLPPGGEGARLAREAAAGVSRSSRPARKAERQSSPTRRTKAPAVAAPPEPEVEPTMKAWPKLAGPVSTTLVALDMSRQCRMPLWADDAKGGLYCGKPVQHEGSRWCAACAALVFESRPRRMSVEQLVAAKPNRTGLPQRSRSGSYR